MKASQSMLAVALALGVFFASSAESRGLKMAYNPSATPLQQATQAEIVVLGTVTAVEPDIFKMSHSPGGAKVNYMVAVVRVDEPLMGVRGVTHIRVGFTPSAQSGAGYGEDQMMFNGRTPYTRGGNPQLREGQEGCFFFKKHHEGDFYVMPQFGAPLLKSHQFFDDELGQIKKALKVLDNPVAALKAKDSADRQFAACFLVHKYRSSQSANGVNPPVPMKSEPIPEEESKLILNALGEMTWGDMGVDGQGLMTIQNCFWHLPLTDKDGWKQPLMKEGDDYNTVMGEAVKKWIKENNTKYRIQRNVAEKKKSTE